MTARLRRTPTFNESREVSIVTANRAELGEVNEMDEIMQ